MTGHDCQHNYNFLIEVGRFHVGSALGKKLGSRFGIKRLAFSNFNGNEGKTLIDQFKGKNVSSNPLEGRYRSVFEETQAPSQDTITDTSTDFTSLDTSRPRPLTPGHVRNSDWPSDINEAQKKKNKVNDVNSFSKLINSDIKSRRLLE